MDEGALVTAMVKTVGSRFKEEGVSKLKAGGEGMGNKGREEAMEVITD